MALGDGYVEALVEARVEEVVVDVDVVDAVDGGERRVLHGGNGALQQDFHRDLQQFVRVRLEILALGVFQRTSENIVRFCGAGFAASSAFRLF